MFEWQDTCLPPRQDSFPTFDTPKKILWNGKEPFQSILIPWISYLFSHPDYHCRLRNHTGSAAFERNPSKALAGFTAGGDFHPALKNRLFSLDCILHLFHHDVKSLFFLFYSTRKMIKIFTTSWLLKKNCYNHNVVCLSQTHLEKSRSLVERARLEIV